MTRTIDFYFDFPSPYAYLAYTQLPRIAAEHGAAIAYHPFRILELMKLVGNRPTTIECKNKGKYASTDLQRWVKRYKVDFARNPNSKDFDFAELDRGALVAIEPSPRDEAQRIMAIRLGPAQPRGVVWNGAGASLIFSQSRHVSFSRT